jgi:carotenoid cleavage dioxygenase-like enzyme
MVRPSVPNPFLEGNFAPIWTEADAFSLPIRGELPAELQGTLFRNGPNPQFMPANPHHHWFAGDGMIHAFTVDDGRVRYRNRWVRTPKWRLEHAAGRSLIDPFGPPDPAIEDADGTLRSVANTNIIYHGHRLLALEEGSLPMELSRRTLETVGFQNFGGTLSPPFTAHPKVDPVTGSLCFFGYSAAGPFSPDIVFGSLDRDGKVERLDTFRAPYASMVHDFCVTERHLLFPIMPVAGSLERAMQGLPPYAWEPERGTYLGVLRRDAPATDIRWVKTEACFAYHVMNAWEDENGIHADVMQSEEAPGFPWPDGRPTDPARTGARMCRWTVSPGGGTDAFRRRYFDDLCGEFPRFDERRAGLAYRHGFYACSTAEPLQKGSFNAIARLDVQSGSRSLWELPAGDITSEPVFVPRTPDAPEGDGFVLAVIWRAAERRSDFAVLRADCLAAGPIALAELSSRVPFGFHGNWLAAGVA